MSRFISADVLFVVHGRDIPVVILHFVVEDDTVVVGTKSQTSIDRMDGIRSVMIRSEVLFCRAYNDDIVVSECVLSFRSDVDVDDVADEDETVDDDVTMFPSVVVPVVVLPLFRWIDDDDDDDDDDDNEWHRCNDIDDGATIVGVLDDDDNTTSDSSSSEDEKDDEHGDGT